MNDIAIVVAEPVPEMRARLARLVNDRYAADYRIAVVARSDEAIAVCEEMASAGGTVALLIASHRLEPQSGSEQAGAVRRSDPDTRCLLLAGWEQTADPRAMRAAAERRRSIS